MLKNWFVSRRQGFTLIELLIVVAIIAILAAIAVPNFLEAQVRAKVSRTLSDMRTMRTGLEAYRVDGNVYPETDEGLAALTAGKRSLYRLSTPVAYLTSMPQSPWKENYGTANPADPKIAQSIKSYLYVRKRNSTTLAADPNYRNDRAAYILQGALASTAEKEKGEWELKSSGPDNRDDVHEIGASARLYDPTNGTVSPGDIATFSDKSTDNKPG